MNKYLTIILLVLCVVFTFGCHTVRNTVAAPAIIAKGVADDAVPIYKGIIKADEWFQENYW